MWRFSPLPLAGSQIQSTALGGSAITPQQGAFTKTFAVALSGSSSTCSAGTLAPSSSKELSNGIGVFSGAFILSARGNVGSTQTIDTVAIFGEDITSGAGSVTVTNAPPLSGSASTTGIGSLLVVNNPTTFTSDTISVGQGDVTPSGFSVTVNLNAGEMEMVGLVGSVGTAGVITTQAITSALQSFAAVLNTPTDTLLGIQSTLGQGTMAANQDVEDTFIQSALQTMVASPEQALTGSVLTGSQGTVGATEDTTLDLVGEEDVFETGDVGFSVEFELTGVEAIGEQYFVGAPAFEALIGEESIVSAGEVRDFADDDRDFPLVGQSITATSDAALAVDFIMQPLDDNLITSEQYLFNVDAALEGIQIEMGQGRVNSKGRSQDAGDGDGRGNGKDKKKKKKVMVDGQHFEVDDDELKDLLQLAKEVATAKAKEEADAAVAAMVAKKSSEKIRLTVPKVTGSDELKDAIADIYMQATIDAEVSRNRQLDEEEALVLLLLN
jgi:hypothetical protein